PISKLLEAMRASAVEGRPALPPVFYLASCYGASGTEAPARARQGQRQLTELGAVKGEGPSTAAALQREGCPAVVAYFGPVGDQLSTRAEVTFYSGLVAGKRLTESVRAARLVMAGALGENDVHYRYPLGWAQLALYLRGEDAPIAKGGEEADDDIYALEQELHRPDSPIHALDPLRSGMEGFIGRRKDLAMLRRRHIQGRRIFVLHGLGGVGKTALAVNLIPKLNAPPERIIMLDAARADNAADPVQDLWEQMTDPLAKAFPDLLANVLETHKENQDPLALLRAVIDAVKKPWLIYLDNAESLQTKVESEAGDLGAWASPGMAQWWRIVSSGAVHGGPLTLAATTRYLWEGLDRLDSRQVGVLRPADIARMMRWLPCLRRMPHARKKRMVQWLNG
ncbi:MAG: CHAT domain-containing protein, partial [Desulfobacterales bacterium]|nr:CHAT domain-containing protein [Desulfobacterales bacterium]